MIRGLTFEGPNKWYPAIKIITENIDLKKYYWFVADEDVVDGQIETGIYIGSKFEKVIDGDYYAISIYLQAYIIEDEYRAYKNFDDYLKSKCELIFMIDDNCYFYILAKDTEIIETIKRNAENNAFHNIQYITDENERLDRYFFLN